MYLTEKLEASKQHWLQFKAIVDVDIEFVFWLYYPYAGPYN